MLLGMRSPLLLCFLLSACGSRLPDADNPLGAFTMQWEPVIDASPGMTLSLAQGRAWVVVDEELTVYDLDWTATARVGGVQAAAGVLDVGLWLTNGLVLRSEADSAGILVALPAELGTPVDLRRGDGGELWILGQAPDGGALASSVDAGINWRIVASGLTAGGSPPETLELRNTLGGLVVVQATSISASASTTYKVTGSGAEEWLEGSFLRYPAARLPDGWATTLPDDRPQFDASTAGFAERWTLDEPEDWHWTHATGIDLSPERTGLTVVDADATGVVYAHDETTLYRTTTPFSPTTDQADAVGAGVDCPVRYRLNWEASPTGSTNAGRVRNGLSEEVWLHRIERTGLTPLHEDGIAPDSGVDVALGSEEWLYVSDAWGRCLYLAPGSVLGSRDFWIEPG